MKKIVYLLMFVLSMLGKSSNATVITVNVNAMTFTPANMQVMVGDTIMWMLTPGAGFHTVTSTTIPTLATSFDAQINSNTPMLMYNVTVEGEYDYVCSFHSSMGMIAHFSVLGSTGLPVVSDTEAKLLNNLIHQDLRIQFNSNKTWDIEVRNLTGAIVKTFRIESQKDMTENISLGDLNEGIYIIRLSDGIHERSQRVIKQ